MSSTLTDRIRGVATSVAIKVPVRCCTTENITLSGLQTIDGVSLAAGDRVLVRNQTDAVTNGIWTASIGAWARAIDFNGTHDAVLGTEVYVQSGTVNGDLRFALTTSAPVIGSSSLTFTAISGTVTLLAEEARDAAISAASDAAAAATAAGLAAGTAETAAGDAQGFAEAAEALVGSFNPAAAAEATASAATAVEAAGQADTARDEAVAARDEAVGVADNLPDWHGAWETGVAYETGDLIQTAGSSYICIVAHTSGTFATDLGAGRWDLFAAKGAAGAGTGDMLGANNLSDVENAAAARGNLGLADMATQAPGAVAITGGNISGIVDLAIADGGTGASTADAALNNLGGTTAGKALFKAADVAAQMTALGAAPLDSPAFTGNPTAPTQSIGNDSTRIATTAFVHDEVPALLNASGSAPIYACRAWVNFNGTGTPAIRASGNVSSITDNGTGDYTVSFTTPMPDGNYAVTGVAANSAGTSDRNRILTVSALTSGSARVSINNGSSQADPETVTLQVIR